METLRKLMNSKHTFEWTNGHTEEFNKVKKMLTLAAVLWPFNSAKKTTITSRLHGTGIGYTLMQHEEEKPQFVMCGSRSITNKQANYATAKLETLAMLYACQSCKHQLQSVSKFEVKSTYRRKQVQGQIHIQTAKTALPTQNA